MLSLFVKCTFQNMPTFVLWFLLLFVNSHYIMGRICLFFFILSLFLIWTFENKHFIITFCFLLLCVNSHYIMGEILFCSVFHHIYQYEHFKMCILSLCLLFNTFFVISRYIMGRNCIFLYILSHFLVWTSMNFSKYAFYHYVLFFVFLLIHIYHEKKMLTFLNFLRFSSMNIWKYVFYQYVFPFYNLLLIQIILWEEIAYFSLF